MTNEFNHCIGHLNKLLFLQAYASGCDIVILASNFQRVVTIPGVLRGSIKVSCVDCSTDTGKVRLSLTAFSFVEVNNSWKCFFMVKTDKLFLESD